MPKPVPTMPTFSDGQDFDTDEKLKVLNLAFHRIKDKFGALVGYDLSATTLWPRGPIDMRSYLMSNVKETAGVINAKADGRYLDEILNDATVPTTVFLPQGFTAEVTTPAILRDECQVIGVGWGCNVRSVTPGMRAIFEVTGGKNWALRNLRVDGGRAAGTPLSHKGIYISGVDEAEGYIDAVRFGTPVLTGSVTNALPSWAIYISDSSRVKILGTKVRLCSEGGIYAKNTTYLDIYECGIQRNEGPGVELDTCESVRIFGSRIQWNDSSNVRMSDCTFVSIFGNDIECAGSDGLQAASVGTKSNVYAHGATDLLIVDNRIIDHALRTDIATTMAQKTVNYQVEMVSSPKPSRLVMVGNYLNETSQSDTHGRVNLITDAACETNWVKDQNILFGPESFVALKRGHGGWKPLGSRGSSAWVFADSNGLQWNNYTNSGGGHIDDPTLGSTYETLFVNVGRQPGLNIPSSRDINEYAAIDPLGANLPVIYDNLGAQHCWWSPNGSSATRIRIGMKDLINRLSNRGNTLTPAVVGSGITHLSDEVGAVHATFNIFERSAGMVPEHPSGMLRVDSGYGHPERGIHSESDWQAYWGDTGGLHNWSDREVPDGMSGVGLPPGGGTSSPARVKMNENVLSAFITSATPYGYDTGVTAGDTKRAGSFVVIWSGVTNDHRDQRPTWVSIHV